MEFPRWWFSEVHISPGVCSDALKRAGRSERAGEAQNRIDQKRAPPVVTTDAKACAVAAERPVTAGNQPAILQNARGVEMEMGSRGAHLEFPVRPGGDACGTVECQQDAVRPSAGCEFEVEFHRWTVRAINQIDAGINAAVADAAIMRDCDAAGSIATQIVRDAGQRVGGHRLGRRASGKPHLQTGPQPQVARASEI